MGSVFLNFNNDIIEIIYKVSAPKTAIVIISPVLLVYKAAIPRIIFTISAFVGVENFVFILPKNFGAKFIFPSSIVALPPARINP